MKQILCFTSQYFSGWHINTVMILAAIGILLISITVHWNSSVLIRALISFRTTLAYLELYFSLGIKTHVIGHSNK